MVQLARLGILGEGDVMHLLPARQPDRRVAIAIRRKHALHEVEAEHLGEDLLHFGHVGAIQQRMIEADRGDAVVPRLAPRGRVDQRNAVADLGLFGIQLHHMAGGQRKAHALAGFQHLAGGNAFRLDAIGLQVGIELVEGGGVEHPPAEEVQAGTVSLTNHVTAVIALVPTLEIHPPRGVTAGFHQTEHITVKVHALFQIQHAHLGVARAQNTSHCHISSPLFLWMLRTEFQRTASGVQTFFCNLPITFKDRSLEGYTRQASKR